jgi:hypothetical protein
MKYVLYVNGALKLVLNEVDSPKALRFRDDGRAQVYELIVPDVFPFEAAHALTRAERRRLIADDEQFWGEIMVDCPRLFPSLPLAQRALAVSLQARTGFYECLYVAMEVSGTTLPGGGPGPRFRRRPASLKTDRR